MTSPRDSVSWTPADIPDLSGTRALVTGATSTIGETVVRELAMHGAAVVLGSRRPAALEATISRVEDAVPGASLQPLALDQSDLASVRRAASQVDRPLDLLVHHPGGPSSSRRSTADGLDEELATHHFGPFALTGLLLPRLVDTGAGRVVMTGSPASRLARQVPLEDPFDPDRRRRRGPAYAAATLAGLMFVLELDRRARDLGVPVVGLAAHCGYPWTRGGVTSATRDRVRGASGILDAVTSVVGQAAPVAAWPLLMAATADLPGSTYLGPDGPLELKGQPRPVRPPRAALDRDARRELWELSERVTGVRYLT